MLRVSGVTIAAGLITKVSVRLTMKKANFYVNFFFFFIKRKKEKKKYPNVPIAKAINTDFSILMLNTK